MDINDMNPQVNVGLNKKPTMISAKDNSAASSSAQKLKENARRTLKLSIPKMQMAEQQRSEVKNPRIVTGSETVIKEEPMSRSDAISAMFLNATTPPQTVKTVSPCSGTNRTPMINQFMENNPKQFSRFLSFNPNSSFTGGLIESTDLVSFDFDGNFRSIWLRFLLPFNIQYISDGKIL